MPTQKKNAIKAAFITLLEEKSLSKITVKDIVNICNVNRNSFYYYFEDIPALLEEVITDQANSLINLLPNNFTLEDALITVLKHVEDKKHAVYHIWHSQNREAYEAHLIRICGYSAEKYVSSIKNQRSLTDEEAAIFTDILKCEFMGQILEWIHQDMSYDLVEHAKKICQCFYYAPHVFKNDFSKTK